uniref:Acyl-Coenzyme A binding domain containing 3 n=1 Tax=Cyprinus carpio TaxID=7962 RepID=A0A8C2HKM9_CYPCA
MATEVQSGDLNSANSSRLEVSIDGLTLSPDSEGEQEQAEASAAHSAGNPELSDDGEEGDPASSATIEGRWGFSLVELYGLALRFFKEKDGKAFHPTYEDKLRLVALHKQVLLGPYNPDASPEVGFFDVLGNDRRKEWASLGNMEKDEAMLEFVKLLNKCCSLFAPFVASHKIEKEEEEEEQRRREEEERERLRQEEERRRREEEERLRREEEERRQVEEERLRVEQQK